jgi:NAD(P)-dependent dehydrogenase (short-subunit alcohol dehydrogenase family)
MKVIVVGTGTIGQAVRDVLIDRGDEVISVGRTCGDRQADVTDIASLRALFSSIGEFDAVANAAGDVFPAPLEQTTDQQWTSSVGAKGFGQINVVRAALPHISGNGSFTLISGILGDEFTHASSIGATVNSMVEGFVKAAATELPRGLRINCISPTILSESTDYHAYFPGFTPVPAHEVAQAYVRAISNPGTGRITKLHKTNS